VDLSPSYLELDSLHSCVAVVVIVEMLLSSLVAAVSLHIFTRHVLILDGHNHIDKRSWARFRAWVASVSSYATARHSKDYQGISAISSFASSSATTRDVIASYIQPIFGFQLGFGLACEVIKVSFGFMRTAPLHCNCVFSMSWKASGSGGKASYGMERLWDGVSWPYGHSSCFV
jgi:hypothetical protein